MKRVKMVLYGAPGTGKSVFACRSDKPFFICTDGNYEWLEEFGAKEEDHVNVSSWAEINDLINNPKVFDNYETIVVDLLEDAFKWCEQEYCVRNNIEHPSDQGYGKGWDSSRNEFFIGISKLLSLDKNILLLMHGISYVEKDRRGIEHTKYGPSTRLPDKVVDMIEGRVRYFLRCYLKDKELEDGTLIKERYLSLVPKPNELGIIRGINENSVPHDIPLDWNEFAKVIGLYSSQPTKTVKKTTKEEVKEELVIEPVKEEKTEEPFEQIKLDIPSEISMPKVEETYPVEDETPFNVDTSNKVEVQEAPKEEIKAEVKPDTTTSNADKLAAIKAKLAALKNKQ